MKKEDSISWDEKHPKKSFLIYMIGISFMSCGQYTLIGLQSSINVEDGLGTLSLTLHYASTLVVAILSPAFVQLYGIKTGLLISDVTALIYCLSNFYSSPYLLIPGNIIYGLGKALYWVASGSYVVYYAKLFHRCKLGSIEANLSKFSGILFVSMNFAGAIGFLMTTFLFEIDIENESILSDNNTTTNLNYSTIFATTESSTPMLLISDICGAKDCQNPEVTEQTISNYVPPDPISIFIVVGVFSGLAVIGLILHFLFAPSNNSLKNTEEETNAEISRKTEIFDLSSNIESTDSNQEKKKENGKKLESSKSFKDKLKTFKKEVTQTLQQFMLPDQLFLMFLQFFAGFNRTFENGDVTRGYISCVYGVAEIGISVAILYASICVFSFAAGKVSSKYGRTGLYIVGFFGNITTYLFLLLWVPTESSELWVIYTLHAVFGIADAVWFSTSTACVGLFFPNNSSKAFTCWISFVTLSSAVGYAWSTGVCVNVKIYVLIACLCVSVIMQFVAEHRLKKRKSEESFPTEIEAITYL